MSEDRTGGYISNLVFNNGLSVDIAPNDIVIFVGPNNAGKSQSLKDIYTISKAKSPTIVISDIKIKKYQGQLKSILDKISKGINQGNVISYQVLGGNVAIAEHTNNAFQTKPYYEDFRLVFIANIDTSARLSICSPPKNIPRNAPKQHPIHYAAFNSKYRKWISDNFRDAFGEELIPNTQFGATIPLCIGKAVRLDEEFEDEQTRQEKYATILDGYKQVHEQGDGIKSFTGILLYLMLDYYCTYLIDEPEAFLHPPQAKIMGQIIGKTLQDHQQAFISTHSQEIIKGLLETCPERLKIIRITRDEDTNYFSVLNNDSISKIWNDTLLKHSNIMSSLFHKSVVLCESDADCQIYSIIESHIKQKNGKYSETMFIHCGGKQRMAKIISALRTLNVDVKMIPDIDVLNNKGIFKDIIEAYDLKWDDINHEYEIISSNLHSSREKINRTNVRNTLKPILDSQKNDTLSSDEIKVISESIKTALKWDEIKKIGISAIPSGNATQAYQRLNSLLKSSGIFMVSVGELEGFIREVGGHGPAWVNSVLENYPDLDDEVYKNITEFIGEMNL